MAKEKVVIKPDERAVDEASIAMIQKSEDDCVDTCYSRYDTQKNQCKFGRDGTCCKICQMGPCKITAKAPLGICGADADTIAARNYLRSVAAGGAAHSDHGRHLVIHLRNIAEGKKSDYQIKDVAALKRGCVDYGVAVEVEGKEREVNDMALELSNLFLSEFTKQEDNLDTLKLAPVPRQAIWEKLDVKPQGIDRMVIEAMHRTNMGVDHNYKNILKHAFRTSLTDGWGGSRVATIVSDIMFGTPTPVKSTANLGVLEENSVNILVHGHEPALSEMLAVATGDPEIIKLAKEAGAEGVVLAGICCTANEILMRHGIPLAGNFLQQELAIITGAVEAMVIDVQCCMPSLPDVARAYHTKIISTCDIAKMDGAEHKSSHDDNALEVAKTIVKEAIENFKKRDPAKVSIPKDKQTLIGGFSVEAIKYMLGGTYRSSFRPLNDAIMSGRIRGVAALVGCSNPKTKMDDYTNELTKILLEQNILIVKTGCAAVSSAKAGMMTPETAINFAAPGLKEVCETVGIPPVLHMGSCVDNSRVLEAVAEIVKEGGLGDDMSAVPAVGVAPEWMSEKAITIGCYVVASGIDVVLGSPFYIQGAEKVSKFLYDEVKEHFGACFHVHTEAQAAADKIIALIDGRREKLGINKKQGKGE